MQGEAYAKILGIFKEVPQGSRLELLKAVSGSLGHRALPGLGLASQPNVPSAVRKAPKAPPQPKSQKSAKQLEIESKIRACNARISEKSSQIGAKLQQGDPLLEERQQFFRELSSLKTGDRGPQSGPVGQNL